MRIAVVRKDRCNPAKCQDLCMKLCPVNRAGEDCIKIEDSKAAINEVLCTGCGICPNRCPFDAISIINLPEELASTPVHRYGQNGFHLYNLPIPMFGKVVGMIGRNGIGKSTALKILAGVLVPNMGDDSKKDIDYDAVIEFFKGTEAQSFFEKLRDGKIKVSYKPQSVDQIPKQFDGTVRELLTKVSEDFGNVVEELDLTNFLDTDIKNVSGGELQRVAIAATVLKDANLYIFDEPTSYLDIRQRIRVSNFIKKLANESTAVLVVEHDLIIFDYITDLVHIMYGKESCYGVVSGTKSSKAGINTFLSGYLREENVRFRDNHIKFISTPPPQDLAAPHLIGWDSLQKTLGQFSLEAGAGELKTHEVVGVLGENGIGKTTFVKILAGVLDPDKGKITDSVKVSYKPQYLEPSEELVASVLADAQPYKNQILAPLNIEPLLTKRLDELSGGQLQRVAIADCLSKEAELFLMDEPSAYLDVEQRLIVSKVIRDVVDKRGISALIVDHDLLFIDYLSHKIMRFVGEPAKHGAVMGPFSMGEGMDKFLESLDITMRRDAESHRPRVNKKGSQMDEKQKSENKRYYI